MSATPQISNVPMNNMLRFFEQLQRKFGSETKNGISVDVQCTKDGLDAMDAMDGHEKPFGTEIALGDLTLETSMGTKKQAEDWFKLDEQEIRGLFGCIG